MPPLPQIPLAQPSSTLQEAPAADLGSHVPKPVSHQSAATQSLSWAQATPVANLGSHARVARSQ